jgi:hypothetical protein
MEKNSKLHLLLARVNAAGTTATANSAIINLTEELSHVVRGGLNSGCGEELPNSACSGNNGCNNSMCDGSNSPNSNCTNNSCYTRYMTNTACTNNSCTN